MSSLSSYMNLIEWSAGDVFDYTQLASNWELLDAHDHAAGRGKQIPAEGIAANAIKGGSSGHILAGSITPNELSFTPMPLYRGSALLPKTQTYSTGTITLNSAIDSNNNSTVTGTDTTFNSSMVGATITAQGLTYLVTDYTSATQLSVSNPNQNGFVGSTYSLAYTLTNDTQILTNAFSDAVVSITGVSASTSGGYITYTATAHGLLTGEIVTISGITGGTNLNGTYTIYDTPTADTFRVANSSASGSSTGNGSITNVRSGTVWGFRYSTTDFQWNFTGGGILAARNSTGTATSTGTTYGSPLGSITFPYKGAYHIVISGDITFSATTTVYLQAGSSTPGNDTLASAVSGTNGNVSQIYQNRVVNITAENTTYNLYVKASSTSTIKNWTITALPLFVVS